MEILAGVGGHGAAWAIASIGVLTAMSGAVVAVAMREREA